MLLGGRSGIGMDRSSWSVRVTKSSKSPEISRHPHIARTGTRGNIRTGFIPAIVPGRTTFRQVKL
jgi:hypothetical protein